MVVMTLFFQVSVITAVVEVEATDRITTMRMKRGGILISNLQKCFQFIFREQ